MWKVRALFLVPVLTAAAVAGWMSWRRAADREPPARSAGGRHLVVPRIEAFTPDGYASYLAAYPASLGGADAGRAAFLAAAHHAREHVAAYRAVGREHAAEAFRDLASWIASPEGGPPGAPDPAAGRRPIDALRGLIAAHEARLGPDPDPLTVLLKAHVLVRDGRFAEAEPLAARAVGAFPGPVPGSREPHWEYNLARGLRLAVYVELGRWQGPGRLDPPPGVTADGVFWRLFEAGRLDDAGRLLDRWAEVAPDDRSAAADRAMLEYRRGDWAACVAAADRFRAPVPPGGVTYSNPEVAALKAKALARLGRFADADRALAELTGADQVRDLAAFVVALLAGDADRADRLLADGRLIPAGVLHGDEVRPLWRADRFKTLRDKYPVADRPGR